MMSKKIDEYFDEKIKNCETLMAKCAWADVRDRLRKDGFLHKSEIRFPREKDVPEFCSTDEKTLADVSYDRGFNQAISETKKMNGVE